MKVPANYYQVNDEISLQHLFIRYVSNKKTFDYEYYNYVIHCVVRLF